MTTLTVFVGIIAFSNLILLLALAFLAFAVKRLIDQSVKPAVAEAQSTIHSVNEVVGKVEERTEKILEISEETARKVSGTVIATSDMVRHTVTTPLISFSGLVTGISEAIQYFRRASEK